MTDAELMGAIAAKYGDAITAATAGTSWPPEFLAALTANESGLDPTESRFEPTVAGSLLMLLIGRRANFGAITQKTLANYFPPNFTPDQFAGTLVNLCSSWGPTQIMGYQALARGYLLSELTTNFAKHYKHAVEILADFQKQFRLPDIDPSSAEAYFRCWNAGNPNGQTYDPQYVPNGLLRMQLYAADLEETQS